MDFRPSSRRSTFGEALIALGGLAGFVVLAWGGRMSSTMDLWLYAGVLVAIVAFYFLLLLAKAIHLFMAGGDEFWWERHKEHHEKVNK
jgi:hypothetical protein